MRIRARCNTICTAVITTWRSGFVRVVYCEGSVHVGVSAVLGKHTETHHLNHSPFISRDYL